MVESDNSGTRLKNRHFLKQSFANQAMRLRVNHFCPMNINLLLKRQGTDIVEQRCDEEILDVARRQFGELA